MEIEFCGAARAVTGSMHLLHTGSATILLDCGLFQGRRKEAMERNRRLPFDPRSINAVVLSHGHLDHSGTLPVLAKEGYRGPIYATPATRDVCAAMLEDSAAIQDADARHIAKLIRRGVASLEPVTPIYDKEDVTQTMALMIGVPYHRPQVIAPGVTLTFLDAGHVLGSAICVLDVEEGGRTRRLAYTGDLGRSGTPILRDPEVPTGVEVLLMESTYGDRNHGSVAEREEALVSALTQTRARGGKVVIPSFALERAQDLLYTISALRKKGRIPTMPVFVDSPLTVRLTDIFRLHPECYDEEMRARLLSGDSPFDFEGLSYVSSSDDSKAIDTSPQPAVIIAASGMAEGGRVLHHLNATVEDPKNTVLMVGYQAEHTLGRRLAEHRERVKIFGVEKTLRAQVLVLSGFSAHADQRELLDFVRRVKEGGPLREVALVHGEPRAQDTLLKLLAGVGTVRAPDRGERISF